MNQQPDQQQSPPPPPHTPGPWRVRVRRNATGEIADCFVTAPDVNGFPYDAQILGDDEYRTGIERKLADACLAARALQMDAEMLRYLPILERAQADPQLWEQLTRGTGIATLNGYRAALSNDTVMALNLATRADHDDDAA